MRKRAENVDETRRRIVAAAVHLHGTIGPAATTMTGVAERAGVTRLTLYRHFPGEEELFQACSAHWYSQQVPPDPAGWARTAGARERLRTGLADVYRFYRDGEPMLALIHRDWHLLPAERREASAAAQRAWCDLLLEPFHASGARARRLRAAIAHALEFGTWQSLCRTHGLDDRAAVRLMVGLADAALRSAGS